MAEYFQDPAVRSRRANQTARCSCKLVATRSQIGHPAGMDAISPKILPDPPAAMVARGVLGASGWHSGNGADAERSLSEVNATIPVPIGGHWLRRLLAFAGP